MPTVSLMAKAFDTEKRATTRDALEGVDRRTETRLESMQRRRRARIEPALESAS